MNTVSDKAIEYLKAGLAVAVAVLFVVYFVQSTEHSYPPGKLVSAEPLQSATTPRSWNKNGFTITALAQYHIEALVISTERYWLDAGAALSPVDFAVGWGPMSDPAVVADMSFSQGHRWFSFRPSSHFSLPLEAINSHAANMHMIPADRRIEQRLKSIRASDIVTLNGYLVEAAGRDKSKWRSSLSRTDAGSGACELMWVEEVSKRQ
jgi:hypothetical protein